MPAYAAVSSARASSSVAFGARRANNSVIRCVRSSSIVAPRWCGLLTMLAMISVAAGYGTDGSRTPITVATRSPSRTVLPTADGSLLNAVVQNRCVSTATGSASGPSSTCEISRPSTGRRPMTSKYAPSTTPDWITRGSPWPTIVNSIVENSPNAATDVDARRRSRISGTENVMLSTLNPGALCRM
jgi:hypothetical protein